MVVTPVPSMPPGEAAFLYPHDVKLALFHLLLEHCDSPACAEAGPGFGCFSDLCSASVQTLADATNKVTLPSG